MAKPNTALVKAGGRHEAGRVRSPNYPVTDLQDALERLRIIYKKEKRAETTADVLAEHFGYKQIHGKSKRVVSALKQFGLLDERGGLYRVSDLGFKLLHLTEDSAERAALLKEAAMQPAIFRELMASYPDGLPSEPTLRSYLILHKGFNPAGIPRFIRVFKGTIEFANIGSEDYIDAEVADIAQPQEEMALQPASQIAKTSAAPPTNTSDQSRLAMYNQLEGWEDTALWFKISQDSEARIIFKGQVTQQAIEKLVKLLEVSKDTFPSSGQPSQPTTQAIYDAIREAAQAALIHTNWGVKMGHVFRSQGNSNEWRIELEDGSTVVVDVAPTATVEEIKSAIMGKLVAGEIN